MRKKKSKKKKRSQLIDLDKIGRISSMYTIISMQLYVMVALNLGYIVIVTMVFWYFCNIYHCRIPRVVPVSNLRLFRYMCSILHLVLSLEN